MPVAAIKEFAFNPDWPIPPTPSPPPATPDIRDPTYPKLFYWWNIFEYLHTTR